MIRWFFSPLLLATIGCTLASAAPQWRAPHIAKGVKDADAIVEKAGLPPSAFPEASSNSGDTAPIRHAKGEKK
jgi:hypothetical protein